MSSLGERLGPRSEVEEARASNEVVGDMVEGPPARDKPTSSRLRPTPYSVGGVRAG